MTDSPQVSLEIAAQCDEPVLANLFELYAHDLCSIFDFELRADGRFGYDELPLYWSEPERRCALLIRLGTRLAGFAMMTRGSPATNDPTDLDVANFFVVRRYRRLGVGRRAAFLLWNEFPGRWVVRVSAGNHAGCDFWQQTVGAYSGSAPLHSERPGSPHAWRVFQFASAGRLAVAAELMGQS